MLTMCKERGRASSGSCIQSDNRGQSAVCEGVGGHDSTPSLTHAPKTPAFSYPVLHTDSWDTLPLHAADWDTLLLKGAQNTTPTS